MALTVSTVFDSNLYRLGLGTYSLTGEEGTEMMVSAIDAGYRHLDTAHLYGNESEVGDAIDATTVDRDELCIATKVAHFEEPDKTTEYVKTTVEEGREKLGIETIDLLYHHWPRQSSDIEVVLPAMADLYEGGIVDRIGVSNYRTQDIERATNLVDVPLYANQIEMHPLLQQDELYHFCRDRDMFVVAYSPLAQGRVFDVPELVDVAEKHDTTPAVVSLAWLLSRDGVVAIPRSSSEQHIRENLAARDLELDETDREKIDSIDGTYRCENPDWMEW